jgi:hypothetical protein
MLHVSLKGVLLVAKRDCCSARAFYPLTTSTSSSRAATSLRGVRFYEVAVVLPLS